VISASYDKSLLVWSLAVAAWELFGGHTHAFTALAILPDGRVVSGSSDGSVRVWSWVSGKQHSFIADRPITHVSVTPEGAIVAACGDGVVHILHVPPEAPDADYSNRTVHYLRGKRRAPGNSLKSP